MFIPLSSLIFICDPLQGFCSASANLTSNVTTIIYDYNYESLQWVIYAPVWFY